MFFLSCSRLNISLSRWKDESRSSCIYSSKNRRFMLWPEYNGNNTQEAQTEATFTPALILHWSQTDLSSVYIELVWFLSFFFLPCQQLVCTDKTPKLYPHCHWRPRPDIRLLPRWVLTAKDCLLLLIKIVFTLYLYWFIL